MSIEKTRNAKLILERLKYALDIEKDGDLADYLGIAQSTLSSWKARGTIDYELVFAKCNNLRADYIIYGQEPIMRHTDDWIREPDKPYMVPNQLESFRKRIINLDMPIEEKLAMIETVLDIYESRNPKPKKQ